MGLGFRVSGSTGLGFTVTLSRTFGLLFKGVGYTWIQISTDAVLSRHSLIIGTNLPISDS